MSFRMFREYYPFFAGYNIKRNSSRKIESMLEFMGKIIKSRGLTSSYVATCKFLANDFIEYCTFFGEKPDVFFYNVLWGLENLSGKTLKKWCETIKTKTNALGLQ